TRDSPFAREHSAATMDAMNTVPHVSTHARRARARSISTVASRSSQLLVEDVAERYGVAPETVRDWCRTRSIPHRRLSGKRRLYFDADELGRWENGAELEVRELAAGGRVVSARRVRV